MVFFHPPVFSAEEKPPPWLQGDSGSAVRTEVPAEATNPPPPASNRTEATIIKPFRSADVGAEVDGVVKVIHFEEGEKIGKDQVVVEIVSDRYAMETRQALERIKGLEQDLEFAREILDALMALHNKGAASDHEVLRTRRQFKSVESRLAEAKIELEKARYDLAACRIRAPFTGHMVQRFKQPHETVRRLDRVFSIVDTEDVFAVAHVPEELLPKVHLGAQAAFIDRSNKEHTGKIERTGKVIDPKTKCKKVYVLIPNPNGILESGMTGSLELRR